MRSDWRRACLSHQADKLEFSISSFSSSGRVYRAVQSSKADVRMMRSALFLCNKIFSFPNTAKQFIILHVTTCASHQKHNYFLTNATGNPNIHQHVRREKISTLVSFTYISSLLNWSNPVSEMTWGKYKRSPKSMALFLWASTTFFFLLFLPFAHVDLFSLQTWWDSWSCFAKKHSYICGVYVVAWVCLGRGRLFYCIT